MAEKKDLWAKVMSTSSKRSELETGYNIHFYSLFQQQAQHIIRSHNASKPLFLYLPFQNVHGPTQAPQEYVDKYQFIDDLKRRHYAAMVDIVDEAIGNVTETMKRAG